jgi:PAS domain S-box-containing protein
MFNAGQQLLHSLVDSLPFKFYIVDRALNIVVWNKLAEEGPYGVKRCDAVGKPLKDVFLLNRDRVASPRDMGSVNTEFREVFEKGTVFCAEDISVLKSGEKRYYQVTKTPLYLEGPTVSHVMTIIDDLTEKRKREAGLIMNERLFPMRELAAGIAHQLNNPLTTMMVCVESLLRDVKKDAVSDPELRGRFEKYLEMTYKEILRCENVSSMLSKLGTGETDEVVKTDIGKVITEMLSILTSNRKYSRYEVKTDLKAELPKIMVKENLLRQAFASIILNAFEAMSSSRKGELRVSADVVTENTVRMIMVSFADNGGGIEQTQVNRIFSPFLTAGENGRVCLGLYVAHGILAEHGGRIEVRSNKGSGTVFTVKLPVGLKGTSKNDG